jgi:hypothetical protein
MEYNKNKVEETVMALLSLTMFEEVSGVRAWKGYDWDVMNALHERGWISDPRGKAKSVQVTKVGEAKAKELFQKYFVSS